MRPYHRVARRTSGRDAAPSALSPNRRLRRPSFLPEGRRLPDDVWQQRHRWMTWLLWAHVPALFAFGLFRGETAGEAGVQVFLVAVAGLAAGCRRFGRNVRSASTSLGLVIGASVLVHMSGGSIEAHFQFFVILGFLTLYQAWLPFLLALTYVVIEHGIVGAIDPRAVFNNTDAAHPWKWAAIHGAFVLAASVANLLSWRLVEQEALHDGLTGLPNRMSLLESLDRMLQGRGRAATAVLFIDLDNFKDANDAFGHRIGDDLLIALADRLEHKLRDGDILARLGGDEFAIVLRDVTGSSDARLTAERLLTAFDEPIHIGDVTFATCASIGLAMAADDDTAADLLRNADLAMYEAKRAGGSRVDEYKPSLHTAALRRTELEAELRAGLAAGQFVLHYQPIVDLATGRIVGAEALMRWEHPTRGLLPPAEFITAAEQSGLIIPLGNWAIRAACRQLAEWQQADPDRAPMTVAVNLSPRQLVDRTLVSTVAEALHESRLEPSAVCLEITEGSIIQDFESTLPTLNALRAIGVCLALDDFGTGYSSLSYLRQLPVTNVKIDRSFVGDLDNDSPSGQIVMAIIELAHALGMSVTAEGAETEAQLRALQAMRSDKAQGYLLGRPMPASVLCGLITAGCADIVAGEGGSVAFAGVPAPRLPGQAAAGSPAGAGLERQGS